VVAQSEVTFVEGVSVKNNKVVFSADDRVLIKLLGQKKCYGARNARKFIAEFPSKPWKVS